MEALTRTGRRPAAPSLEQKSSPVLSYPAPLLAGLGTSEHAALHSAGAYRLVWLVYACMRLRASKLMEAPLWVAEEAAGGEPWVRGDHPLARVLERPNEEMEMGDLLELLSLYLDSGGRALLVKSRDRAGRVASLHVFSREEFTVEPAGGRLYGRFRVRTLQGMRELGPDEVILIRETDPADLAGGIGALEVALTHAGIVHEMRLAVTAVLRNGLRPGAWIETTAGTSNLSESEYRRNKAERDAAFAGMMNAGKVPLIEQGKLHLVDRGLQDVSVGPVQADAEVAICGAFAIHPALIGARVAIENGAGLSDSLGPATRLFYDRVVFPRWRKIERALTRGLLREADANPLRQLRFDTSQVRALQDDLASRTRTAATASGYWRVNEQRAHTGQQLLEDGRGDRLGVEMDPRRR